VVPRARFLRKNELGHFSLVGLPTSWTRIRFHFLAEDCEPFATQWWPLSTGTKIEPLHVQLEPIGQSQCVIEGMVLSTQTGKPILGAKVQLLHASEQAAPFFLQNGVIPLHKDRWESDQDFEYRQATTDRTGFFQVSSRGEGDLILSVSAKGYPIGVSTPIPIVQGALFDGEVVYLNPPAKIIGRIIAPEEKRENFHQRYSLWLFGPNTTQQFPIKQDGNYEIGGLESGEYRLKLREFTSGQGSFSVKETQFTLEAAEKKDCLFDLSGSNDDIPGRLDSDAILPNSQSIVAAIPLSTPEKPWFVTQPDSDGLFHVPFTEQPLVYVGFSTSKEQNEVMVSWCDENQSEAVLRPGKGSILIQLFKDGVLCQTPRTIQVKSERIKPLWLQSALDVFPAKAAQGEVWLRGLPMGHYYITASSGGSTKELILKPATEWPLQARLILADS